jgi:TonB family protein
MLAAVAVLGLTWAGVRMLNTSKPPTTPARAVEAAHDIAPQVSAPSRPPIEAARVVSDESSPRAAAAPASSSEVHEEIPDVPRRSLQTIRGHVRVSVRVIVDADGTVFAALTDNAGPSRYFERYAIEAAKKWKFIPTDSGDQRVMVLRFDFTRAGATVRAVTP